METKEVKEIKTTGFKYDGGKQRYDLIPPSALDEVARVYTYGATKYTQEITLDESVLAKWVFDQLINPPKSTFVSLWRKAMCISCHGPVSMDATPSPNTEVVLYVFLEMGPLVFFGSDVISVLQKFQMQGRCMGLVSKVMRQEVSFDGTNHIVKIPGARNWELGMPFGQVLAATYRHMGAFMKGETIDSESGLHHLAHAVFGLFAVMEYQNKNRDDLDDRPAMEVTQISRKSI